MTDQSPKICVVCGHENPPDRSNCANCGIALVERKPNATVTLDSGKAAPDATEGRDKGNDKGNDTGPSTLPIPRRLCPRCSHMNRLGAVACENCGQSLLPGAIATKGVIPPTEARNPPNPHSVFPVPATDLSEADLFQDDMILRLEINGAPNSILVYPTAETIIGRRDPQSTSAPDVDLTALAGYRMGVSRQHAALRLNDRRLDVRDLGSSNGTRLNGVRLTPHHAHILRDGDELTLGRMVLRVHFQAGSPADAAPPKPESSDRP